MSAPCAGCSSAKFTEALRQMMKRGVRVHRDLGVCKGCAAEKLIAEAQAGGNPEGLIGAAFFTKVDAADLANAIQRRDQILKAEKAGVPNLPKPPIVRLWLSYIGPDGKPSADVGAIVAECLREAGLQVDFSGKSPSMAVYM